MRDADIGEWAFCILPPCANIGCGYRVCIVISFDFAKWCCRVTCVKDGWIDVD